MRPIPGQETPAGEDLRALGDDIYFRLKDLRVEARNAEREAGQAPDAGVAVFDAGRRWWDDLQDIGEAVLAERSKDLEIAGWVCEALVRVDGFAGLRRGLETMAELIDRFWDEGLYPHEDEDGVETRIAPVAQLLGQSGVAALAHPIKLVPLSDRAPEAALWKLEIANAPAQGGDDPAARDRATARRTQLLDEVNGGVRRASAEFVRRAHADVAACLELIERLATAADARAGTGRFGSQAVQPLLAVQALFEEQAGHQLAGPAPAEAEAAEAGEGGSYDGAEGAPVAAGPGLGAIRNRSDAYDAILRIADFFAATEPQSLVAKSLRETVRRAKLSVDELLVELIPDPDQRTIFLLRAGVRTEI